MEDESREAPKPQFKRIILKLSGEVLRNPETGDPIGGRIIQAICEELRDVHLLGIQLGIVVGGGNIFRGLAGVGKGVDRGTGDYMGMLATVINGLGLMDRLEKLGVPSRVQSAIPMSRVAEPFIARRAIRHLDKGRVVIFVAGTGNPYFSTDTAAALRASEVDADVILKATKVDGVYDKDPEIHPDAERFDSLSFDEALQRDLKVMDSAAFAMCRDNKMPILVFSIREPGSIRRAVLGQQIGTFVNS